VLRYLRNTGLSEEGPQVNTGGVNPRFKGHDNGTDASESRKHKAVLSENVGDDVVDSSRSCRRDQSGE
jgi:hypothetical protein